MPYVLSHWLFQYEIRQITFHHYCNLGLLSNRAAYEFFIRIYCHNRATECWEINPIKYINRAKNSYHITQAPDYKKQNLRDL